MCVLRKYMYTLYETEIKPAFKLWKEEILTYTPTTYGCVRTQERK